MTKTTDPTTPQYEAAKRNTAAARQALVEATTEGKGTETLMRNVHAVAEAEAVEELELAAAYRIGFAEGGGEEIAVDEARAQVAEYTQRQLMDVGADDTWSGRGNDLRRVVFDAKRDWVRRVIRGF